MSIRKIPTVLPRWTMQQSLLIRATVAPNGSLQLHSYCWSMVRSLPFAQQLRSGMTIAFGS